MNVLLLGKYPPCQGGIAAKTYWLTRALADHDIHFDVVTAVPEVYRSATTGPLPPTLRLHPLCVSEDAPWFLPGSDLWTERLVAAALQASEGRRPDVVEANYLVPFGLAALSTARILGVPLLLRHAGSDLVKLGRWEPAWRALAALLAAADRVVTAADAPLPPGVREGATLTLLPRYFPDPAAFTAAAPTVAGRRLLFAGKLNYHWRLKGLDTLLAVLARRPDWTLVAAADGTGREAVVAEVERHGLADRVRWLPFAPPAEMPALLAGVSAVWAVERPGGVGDFSNLVSEALAAARPCIVSPAVPAHPDAALLAGSAGLLEADPDDESSVSGALDRACELRALDGFPGLATTFREYVAGNASVYAELGGRGA